MKPLQFYQAWVPWYVAAPMLIAYLVIAIVLYRDLDQRSEMVRIVLPAYALLGALVIPAAVNGRYITVSTQGIRLRNLPLPKGQNYYIAREDIRACTIRTVLTNLDNTLVRTYIVGVDCRQGQIDLAYPYSKYEAALQVAQQFAAALNQGPVPFTIPCQAATREPQQSGRRLVRVLLWGGAFIAAIILGAYWEI